MMDSQIAFRGAACLCCCVWLSGAHATEPARVTVLNDSDPEIARIIDIWNRSEVAARKGNYKKAAEIFQPRDRARLGSDIFSQGIIDTHLPWGITPDMLVVYKSSNGDALARVYQESERHVNSARMGRVRLRQCLLLGTLVRTRSGPWLLRGIDEMGSEFGLGDAVDEIRLTVSPTRQTIRSWNDLTLSAALTNVSKSKPVALRTAPQLSLMSNVSLRLIEAKPANAATEFHDWYLRRRTSSTFLFGLFESIHRKHATVSLEPGQSYKLPSPFDPQSEDTLGPRAQRGTFRFYLEYDANVDGDPVEAALPAWSRRVASEPFSVTVE